MSTRSAVITLASGVRGDTRRYRTIHPFEQLRLVGQTCYYSHLADPFLGDKVKQSDLVIFHRVAFDSYVSQVLEGLLRNNIQVLLDIDDYLFDDAAIAWIDSPDFQDPVRAALYREEMQRHRQMLESIHGIMTSTEFLRDQVRLLGRPAWVHRNAFSLEMLALSETANRNRPENSSNVVIGYASGTPTHDRDFAQLRPVIIQLLKQYPQVEIWLVGALNPGRDWEGMEGRLRRFTQVPWRQLPAILARFDINLAPLVVDNPFGQSKSEIKYIEASLVNVPTVASPSQAFQYAIQNGANGFLARTQREWLEYLGRMIEDPGLRKSLGEMAYIDVLERYNPYVRAQALCETLRSACEGSTNKTGWMPCWSSGVLMSIPESQPLTGPEMEETPTLLQLAWFTLRHRGIITLVKQVWIFFRRMLAAWIPYSRS